MSTIDLIILFGTLAFIVSYGVWKTRGSQNIQGYFLANKSMGWGTIGLSVMATQASAITFISTPGQAYESGMSFIQNYLGMPIALIIVSAFFIPIYYRLNVYTAYEFLESRFDIKTRFLGAFLFLVQRGLAAGITIYAPAIIVSTILGWNLTLTILLVGVLVIIYTVSGGTKAVSITQKQQMMVIMGGMVVAFIIVVNYISEYASFTESLSIAGHLGKLNTVDFDFSFEKRYTIWSGIAGGLILQLSYFGTDQSQVQRYIGGKNTIQSKMGMMFNAMLKIPMQFFILLVGVFVYIFYIFYQPPVHFKEKSLEIVASSDQSTKLKNYRDEYANLTQQRKEIAQSFVSSIRKKDTQGIESYSKALNEVDQKGIQTRAKVKDLITDVDPTIETKDADFVFLTFILDYLPVGLIGLLIAVIFSAAMSSISSEVNALASTTVVDFYQRFFNNHASDQHYVIISRVLTGLWGVVAISFALLAKNSENLIEAVNIIGSLFYGTILGIFLTAFFFKSIKGNAVFWGALIAELVVIICHFLTTIGVIELGYLWYNAIGCFLTILLGGIFQGIIKIKS